jgi:hypothetical protein
MKSESLAHGGVMTMTSVDKLNDKPCFSGMFAAFVNSQVGWVCLRGGCFHDGREGVCDDFLPDFH